MPAFRRPPPHLYLELEDPADVENYVLSSVQYRARVNGWNYRRPKLVQTKLTEYYPWRQTARSSIDLDRWLKKYTGSDVRAKAGSQKIEYQCASSESGCKISWIMERIGVQLDLLPLEILAHIFHLLARGNASLPSTSLRKSPVNVSQVCRKWRELSLNTPSLWGDFSWCGHPKYLNVALVRWMSRSGSLPLSVEIDESTIEEAYDEFPDPISDLEAALEALSFTLSLYVNWLESVVLTVSIDCLIDVEKILRKSPLLRKLHLHLYFGNAYFGTDRDLALITSFRFDLTVFPNLRDAGLNRPPWPAASHWIEYSNNPHPNLTSFTFDFGSPSCQRLSSSLSDFNQLFPNLRRLHIRLYFLHDIFAFPQDHLSKDAFLNLEELEVVFIANTPDKLARVLELFPHLRLRMLSLQTFDYLSLVDMRATASFLKRCGSRLQDLRLHLPFALTTSMNFKARQAVRRVIPQFFVNVPQLRKLALGVMYWHFCAMEALTWEGDYVDVGSDGDEEDIELNDDDNWGWDLVDTTELAYVFGAPPAPYPCHHLEEVIFLSSTARKDCRLFNYRDTLLDMIVSRWRFAKSRAVVQKGADGMLGLGRTKPLRKLVIGSASTATYLKKHADMRGVLADGFRIEVER